MPANTATQGFTYPTQTDRACDGAAAFQLMAQMIDDKLTVFDTKIARVTKPLAAIIEYNSTDPVLYDSAVSPSPSLNFNATLVDNGDLVDLTIRPDRVTLPAGYRWRVGSYVEINTMASDVTITLSINNSTTVWNQEVKSAGGIPERFSMEVSISTAVATDMYFAITGGTDMTLTYYRGWAYWIADV